MIDFENFHNQDLKEIVNEAKSKIAYLNPEWTYQGESDPGITLIELFCWLKFVQHEYLNKISPMITIKFLKLLGISLKKNRGSRALLEIAEIEKDVFVPKNTKWKADDLVFENNKKHYLICARILSLEFKNSDLSEKIEFYKLDGIRKFYLFGKKQNQKEECEFVINFDSPLPSNKKINLYFEIFNPEGVVRNPISRNDFIPNAKIIWEYWGLNNGKTGWHEIKVKDKTYNFLFSGIIDFVINGKHEQQNGIYTIRVRLLSSDYDFPPRITKVLTNVFEVEQKDTVCHQTFFKKNEIKILEDGTALIECSDHLAIYGETLVYLKKNKSWIFEQNFILEKKPELGFVYIKIKNISFIDNLVDLEKAVMLVFYDKKFKDKIIIGSGTNFSPQTFDINFERTSLYDSFKLIVGKRKDSEIFFDIWKRVDDFFSSQKFDKHFIYEENMGSLAFGDHTHGVSPDAEENNIILCNLAFTSGSLSNIKKGMINTVESDNITLKRTWVRQITEACGGRDGASVRDALRYVSEVFHKIKRAVTLDDYRKVVLGTPGMAFKNISVFSNKSLDHQVSVTVAVQCGDSFSLSESCRKTIVNRLEKYRLIGTKINVIGPKPLEISFHGKISVNSSFKAENRDIENEVKKFVENLNKKMGSILRYGDIFGRIDNIGCVSHINDLNILSSGDYNFDKFASGDIAAPPNAIYVLKEINFNYIVNTKF
ncbi:MAG: baseplate J/gp47 family protein [Oscillospiraceae bacterium]|jgi:hypothetical protein|nr:baseplate J/gp47 family protein [Oscillospiraceae bacterium]